MSTTGPTSGPRTYGGWRLPKSPGIMGLDLLSSAVLMTALIACILTLLAAGFFAAIGMGVVWAIVLAVLVTKDQHGRSGLERAANRVAWQQARFGGSQHYRSGPIGKARWGTFQLPGLLANTKLHEYSDAWGQPFAILELPTKGHYSVTFRVEPEGSSLVDEDQVNQWVGNYAAVLKALGDEPGLIAAQITVETAPDSGARLRRHIESRVDPNAPEVATAMLQDVMATYPAAAAAVKVWISLTFQTTIHGKRLKIDEFADELKPRLRHLGERFHGTGVGGARALNAQQLCELVRAAYNPAAGADIEEANLAGAPVPLRWSDVGPAGAQAYWDAYAHDDALSITWAMSLAPRGLVYHNILSKLLAPSRQLARKRVSILYRVIDPAAAARTVDADVRTAITTASGSKRPKAKLVEELELTHRTAQEEARGAGLTDFSLMVTATVDGNDEQAAKIARVTVENLGATARLRLRVLTGSQDSAFAGTLPLGVALQEYTAVPREIRRLTR